MPRSIPMALASHLAGGATTMCVLLRIIPTQPGFAEIGVTSLDHDVTYDDGDGPLTYLAAIGTEPSTLQAAADLSVAGGQAKQLMPVFNTPVNETDLAAGAYDFAAFRAYAINYADLTSGHHVVLQTGTLGQNTITDSGLSWTTELRGLTQNLKQSINEKWSLGCRAIFGSVPIGTGSGAPEQKYPCNFDATALWLGPLTVTSVGLETTQLFATTDSVPTTYGGEPGLVQWLTGANAGRFDESETCRAGSLDGINIGLTFGAAYPIAVGDTFKFRDDCDHGPTACKARNNYQNYRGEPSIPVSDNGALSIGQIHSGSSIVTSDDD